MNTLHGLHINQKADHFEALIKRMQPAVILLLHPKAEHINLIRSWSPSSVIIGRAYFPDGDYGNNICTNPVDFARRAHAWIIQQEWVPHVDFVQTHNEVCQKSDWWSADELPPTEIERKAQYDLEWMRLADQSGLYRCAVQAASVGQPSRVQDDGGTALVAVEQVANYAGIYGHVMLVHEYGWPDFWSPDNSNYIGRYHDHFWKKFTSENARNAKVVLGEFGVDRLIEGPKGGWKSLGITKEDYAEMLYNIHFTFNTWRQEGMHFIGAAHFCVCDDDWGDYDAREPLMDYAEIHTPQAIDPIGTQPPIDPPDPEPEPPEPDPDPPEEPGMFERTFSEAWTAGNLRGKLIPLDRLLEVNGETKVYWVKELFTVYRGQWEPGMEAPELIQPFVVPQWARDKYLYPPEHPCYNHDGGGDTHIFAALADPAHDCNLNHNEVEFVTWTGGGENWPNWTPTMNQLGKFWTKPDTGWANVPLQGDVTYYPWDGDIGPFAVCKGGGGFHLSEMIAGMGLPANEHVSWYFIFGETTAAEYIDHFYNEDIQPPNPEPEPPDECPDCPDCPDCPANDCPDEDEIIVNLFEIIKLLIKVVGDEQAQVDKALMVALAALVLDEEGNDNGPKEEESDA